MTPEEAEELKRLADQLAVTFLVLSNQIEQLKLSIPETVRREK